jgi:hypothetical protein
MTHHTWFPVPRKFEIAAVIRENCCYRIISYDCNFTPIFIIAYFGELYLVLKLARNSEKKKLTNPCLSESLPK